VNATQLIDEVRTAGGTLQLTDGKLVARNIPAAMLANLKAAKPAIMALLAANDGQPPSLAETEPTKFDVALAALAACGWIGVSAENVARAIAKGVTDEAQLVALLEGDT